MGNSSWWSKGNIKKRHYLEAQKKQNEIMECLYAYDNNLTENPGIYILTRAGKVRQDGGCSRYTYIGQAKNVLQRLASHFMGFDQRIDVSLKTRALWSKPNPYGWRITVEYCSVEELNQKEREIIAQYQNDPEFELYNITAGGQDEGKEYIGEKKEARKYNEGLKNGYDKCKKEVQEICKYLEFLPKDDFAINDRKVIEFEKWLKE